MSRLGRSLAASLLLFSLLCILSSLTQPCVAASPQEIQAIQDMYDEWPSVRGLTGWSLNDSSQICQATFEGINCNMNGNVQQLFLNSRSLTGTIPDSIGNLIHLDYLSFEDNQLTGSIPNSIENLTLLEVFYLNRNQLTGSIPAGIGNLTNMQTIWLHQNQLTGSIPDGIGNLVNLHQLILDNNGFTGTIPQTIGNLVNLQYLYFFSNQLTGSIPDTMGNLVRIEYMYLRGNQLSGTIPGTLENLVQLKDLCDENRTPIRWWRLDNNRLEVCPTSFNSTELTQLTMCRIDNQNGIISCDCSNNWLRCTRVPSDPIGTEICPTVVPANYPTTQTSPDFSNNNPVPQTSPNSCPSIRPSTDFECLDGRWTLNDSLSSATLVVGGSSVQINGNLTITETTTFKGLDGSVTVTGCVTLNGSRIVVELSESDLEQLSQQGQRSKTLFTSLGDCSSFGSVPLTVTQPKSCKQVKLRSDSSSRSLSVVFRVDSSRCNLWWIILASVLGGVLLIVIIVVVLAKVSTSFKLSARPYA